MPPWTATLLPFTVRGFRYKHFGSRRKDDRSYFSLFLSTQKYSDASMSSMRPQSPRRCSKAPASVWERALVVSAPGQAASYLGVTASYGFRDRSG
jgi:hypothetical protein